MGDRIFADKSKEALLEIVRLTGIMPLEKAQTLSRAKLAMELQALDQGQKANKDEKMANETVKTRTRATKKPSQTIKKESKAEATKNPQPALLTEENMVNASTDQKLIAVDTPVTTVSKRKVGRPRKTTSASLPEKPEVEAVSEPTHIPETQEINPPVKRGRGRPRKNPLPLEKTVSETTAISENIDLKDSVKDNVNAGAEVASKPLVQPAKRGRKPKKLSTEDQVTLEISSEHIAPLSSVTKSENLPVPKESTAEVNVAPTAETVASVTPDRATDKLTDTTTDATQDVTTDITATQADETTQTEVEALAPETEEKDKSTPQSNHSSVNAQENQVTGVLEILPDGYGFLRCENYLPGNRDVYVPPQFVRRFSLRPGDLISGPSRIQRENGSQAIFFIKTINGMPPDRSFRRPRFDKLVPIYPNERFKLETGRNELSTRIIDLIAPIGKGQRGMIVSPPKAGKTILLQKIANAISTNNPEVKLLVLLIDERPEEVTDMKRSIQGEVVYSTFDKTPENHVKVAELVLERAMRLVELGEDVVILLDSITRLARAYNLSINPTGRTLSGGLDPGALYGPKRFFGAARNIENGGSLTIVATSLVDTGSRMDEVIFEEFKGTGNMEVYLDRKLSEKRIFPALDLNRSGTRREELLLSPQELDSVWSIRKAFGQLDNMNVTEMIINLLLRTNTNDQFVSSINVSFNDKAIFESMRGTNAGNKGNTANNSNANNA